ncbi:hypothetical protein K469DRAFT_699688 [Zopfia rhizophila CBS 207.26]|uniref:Uncharacterized protein n=1 Tax=Zopfia rhizophila CBS 207.26 TaxID=1314779 RepID=A0A6A6EIX8_9PEZI|nr:hypothetical protein K469DRAFT_699688 [Zopfia rhizophila CBS 207.26]
MADAYSQDTQKQVDYSGLEVGTPPFSCLPEVAPPPPPKDDPKFVYDSDSTLVPKRKGIFISRQRLLLGLAIALLVIIAVAVGAIVGVLKQNERSQSSQSPNNNGSDPNANSAPGGSIRNGSSIAVTGWRTGNEYSIRLFYQDGDGFLHMSSMESTTGEVWSGGLKFVKAKLGTPLAASSFNQSIYGNGADMEAHVYYLDDSSTLQEIIFKNSDKAGKAGILNDLNIKAASDTRLGAYWPSLAYQNPDNSISEIRYNCTTSAQDCCNNRKLDISDQGPSASLAQVPMGRNLSGIFLYYQKKDHNLVNYAWNGDSDQWNLGDFSQSIPPSAPIGVFGTPRAADSDRLNFHVIWQDPQGILQVSWLQASGWQSPQTSPGLNNAANGTNLACLTPASWHDNPFQYGPELSRCFFMNVHGKLKQVQYGGKAWKDLGIVWNASKNGEKLK